MDSLHYTEMREKFFRLKSAGIFEGKAVFLFGHCNATEELAGQFLAEGYRVEAILDNNTAKQGMSYQRIPIVAPNRILKRENKEGFGSIVRFLRWEMWSLPCLICLIF